MAGDPVIEALGRPLRLAVIGGGPGSWIGEIHRTAARLDGRFDIVAGALSSNPERSRAGAAAVGIEPERAFGDGIELIESEAARADGAEVVAIMTPNDSHHRFSIAALEHDLDVICDKPITNSLGEAIEIVQLVESTGLVFCLTHNYTGYPMVRQARALVEAGAIGEIRLVQVEYVQGGKAAAGDPPPGPEAPWRFDPSRSGPSLVMGDIGTHAHHLVRFVTGLEVAEVAAEVGHVVPARQVDDFGAAMLRFDNGARGVFFATQAATGVENSIHFRVSGSRATLEWQQEQPTRLVMKPMDGAMQVYTPNGPELHAEALRASRVSAGHPEGFHEAFANIYADAAEAIVARRTGSELDPLATWFPTALDGAIGVRFVEATLASSAAGGAWTDAILALS